MKAIRVVGVKMVARVIRVVCVCVCVTTLTAAVQQVVQRLRLFSIRA